MSKDTAKSIGANVRTLAGELKSAMTYATGKVAMNDSAYENHLTAQGLTLEQARNLQDADNTFIAATTLAVSELADNAMKEDSTLNQVIYEGNLGYNKLSTAVTRAESGDNRPLSVVSAYSVVDRSGEVKAVTDHLTQMWMGATK